MEFKIIQPSSTSTSSQQSQNSERDIKIIGDNSEINELNKSESYGNSNDKIQNIGDGGGTEDDNNGINTRNINSQLFTNSHQNIIKSTGNTLRCVCNLSQCASSNYMCKSLRRVLEDGTVQEPSCFIQELNNPDTQSSSSSSSPISSESNTKINNARKGCVEMLSREKQKLCRNNDSKSIGSDSIGCCFNEDMCNYPKSFSSLNVGVVGGPRISFEPPPGVGGGNLDHQVWLRAAVIAVPVCGLMILILLIFVARHLLRGEDDYKEYNQRIKNRNNSNEYQTPELLLPHQHHNQTQGFGPQYQHQHQPCYWCSLRPSPPPLIQNTSNQSDNSLSLSSSSTPTPWSWSLHDTVHRTNFLDPIHQNPIEKKKFGFLNNWKLGLSQNSLRPCHNNV